MPESWRGFPARLAAVVLGALVLRLVYAIGVHGNDLPAGDGFYFHEQGRAIAQGDGFISPIGWVYAGVKVQAAHHPPLYSLFLAIPSVLGFDSPLAHRVVSCFAGAATVALVGLFVRRLAAAPGPPVDGAGERAGLIAAVLVAIYPIIWVNEGLVLSEPLYGITIVAVLFAAYRAYEEPGLRRGAWLGAAVGLAALTRVEASNLLFLLVLPMAVVLKGVVWRQRVAFVLAAGVAYALVISPWVAFNMARFEQPVMLSYGAAGVLPQANCDETYDGPLLGYWSGSCAFPSADEIPELAKRNPDFEVVVQQGLDYLGDGDESVAANEGLHKGLEYIESRPGRAVVVAAARVGRIWGVYRPGQSVTLDTVVERRGRTVSTIGLIMYYEMLALGVAGLVVLRRRGVPILPFLSLALLVTMTATVAIGITRYRFPADLGLAMLAGVSLDALWRRWARAASPPRAGTARGGTRTAPPDRSAATVRPTVDRAP